MEYISLCLKIYLTLVMFYCTIMFSNSLHSKLSDNNILTLRIFMKIHDNTQYVLDFNCMCVREKGCVLGISQATNVVFVRRIPSST